MVLWNVGQYIWNKERLAQQFFFISNLKSKSTWSYNTRHHHFKEKKLHAWNISYQVNQVHFLSLRYILVFRDTQLYIHTNVNSDRNSCNIIGYQLIVIYNNYYIILLIQPSREFYPFHSFSNFSIKIMHLVELVSTVR